MTKKECNIFNLILHRSPLHYTSVNGSYLCTVALVKAGADVNELDVNGCSPLHYAAAAQTSHRYNIYITTLRTADLESIQIPAFFHILFCQPYAVMRHHMKTEQICENFEYVLIISTFLNLSPVFSSC